MSIELSLVAGCDNYCVFGNPIAHSKSPIIQAAFARQTGQKLAYTAVLVPEGRFPAYLNRFAELGGKGANVTVPFKTEAWSLCAQRAARAELAGAVNTLWFDSAGRVQGDNTDGAGLVTDMMANQGWELLDRDILLLGAGGAARGVVPALLAQRPRRIFIANRTPDRAIALARVFADSGPVDGGGFAEAADRFDIVINATSASLRGEVPPISPAVLGADTACYDMMYAVEGTPFLRWANAHGVRRFVDGLGMLVEQAAEAFEIWRGIRPETAPVLGQLRSHSG